MITERELSDAIRECYETSNPNANTCIKLASYLTIRDWLSRDAQPGYSGGGSEFLSAARRHGYEEVLAVMDELMTTLQVANPRLYDSTMDKLAKGLRGSLK